jgi:hypothetical protein
VTKSEVKNLEGRVNQLSERKAPSRNVENPWDRVVAQLTEDEGMELARAIMTLEKSGGRDSLETLPAEQKAAWVKASKLYEGQKS